jgi:drug/metabolite transporter (DMT)-like permease
MNQAARPGWVVGALTAAALGGFAANSLLTRAALAAPARMDAVGFTAVRLVSGAAVLVLLQALASGGTAAAAPVSNGAPGWGRRWLAALALFAYAAPFSLAYVRLPAGAGALTLFGAVQLTMIGAALAGGERPGGRALGGLGLAIAGLVVLTWPGRSAPDAVGLLLMAVAGVAWGVYSLLGRKAGRPLATTARSFVLTVPMVALLLVLTPGSASQLLASGGGGIALALASGALASGLGYSLWYAALPGLTATQAATVQLTVPLLAAAGGVALLGEQVSPRLLLAGTAILTGVALAVIRPRPGR